MLVRRAAHAVVFVVVLALLVVLLPLAAGAPTASAAAAPEGASRLVPVAPTRVMDTRTGTGVAAGARARNAVVTLPVAGRGPVPSTASAVVLNVTITQSAGGGYVQVFPTGQSKLGASSNLNVERRGQTIPNLVTVPVGDGGKVSFYLQAGGHLVADVFGYYEPAAASASGRFAALSPVRILDTRDRTGMTAWPTYPGDSRNCGDFGTWSAANKWFWTYYYDFGDVARLDGNGDLVPCESLPGAPATKQQLPKPAKPKAAGGAATRVQVLGAGGVPATGVSAVALNVTATQPNGSGYVQAVPTGGPTPYRASSNLNLERAGQTIPNLVIVPVGSGGTVDLYTSTTTHLIADVVGYYTGSTAAASADGLFVPKAPARVLDTRSASYATPKLAAGQQLAFQPLGKGGLPTGGVGAVLYNATVTQPAGGGYLQVFPTGQGTPGASSNLNFTRGQTIPNAVITATGNQGRTTAYASQATHLILDVAGYYTDGTTTGGGGGNAALAGLVIAAPNTTTAYNRDDWSAWIDADRDCQDTRAEVLLAETTAAPVLSANGCTVVSGRWVDPYTGTVWTQASDVDVDHTVPLADAHRSGGWAWDNGKKAQYANDLGNPEHLIAIEDGLNAAKSDKSPDQWQPPLASSHCTYANDWITIKKRWSLTVTQAEYNALGGMLATCG